MPERRSNNVPAVLMKQHSAVSIVLTRTNYGEADRIITVLTKDNGKIRLVAKGVRKIRSKLAGGIELFSTNDIMYLPGKGGLGTLVSSRLRKNYGSIVKNIDRTMYAYDALKMIHKITEDSPEPEYFILLEHMLAALNDETIALDVIKTWFHLQLLKLGGHTPNLMTDTEDHKLSADERYGFSFDNMSFVKQSSGPFGQHHITYLRLGITFETAKKLSQVSVTPEIMTPLVQLTRTMLERHSRVM